MPSNYQGNSLSHQRTQIANSTAETTIVTAVAGEQHELASLVLTNETATPVIVTIRDATGGTARLTVALAASGQAILPFPIPVPQLTGANQNWTATLSALAITVDIFVLFVKTM